MKKSALIIAAAVLSTSAVAANAQETASEKSQQVRSHLAKNMLYGEVEISNYRWSRKSESGRDSAMGRIRSIPEKVNGEQLVSTPSTYYQGAVVSLENSPYSETTYRWGIRSSNELMTYRWGIRSSNELMTYRWGIRSESEQQTYRWGIRSTTELQTYRWGIR